MNPMQDWQLARNEEWADRVALASDDEVLTYAGLRERIAKWDSQLCESAVLPGDAVAFESEYSADSCGLLLALIAKHNIAIPLSPATATNRGALLSAAGADVLIHFGDHGAWSSQRLAPAEPHALIRELRARRAAGLIVFSSASTGDAKASLFDFERLLAKFSRPRRAMRTLVFLLFDHLGGINTLLSVLSSGGTLVTVKQRDVDSVCRAIERHKVELLPTSPTFLRLMLLSEAHARHDLSSLRLVTYGTEPMPSTTLKQLNDVFPEVQFKQTYGLTELGVFGTQSRSSDSLWVKVGGDGVEWKVVDGTLRVRTQSAMLGYLNAPQPFDSEGWFNTQDVVDVDGEYLRFRGRKSDIINVGGEKVFPAEVEAVLLEIDNVADATVFGRRSPVMGQVVAAAVTLERDEDEKAAVARIRRACLERLQRYKVPLVFSVSRSAQDVSSRFKKIRASEP